MIHFSRRGILVAGIAGIVAACDNSVASDGAQVIDGRVNNTLNVMNLNFPETRDLAARASGMLVMPLIGTAGFMVGGAYGEGALIIQGVTVDYYSATEGSIGLQVGIKESSQVIFFMTPEALTSFRSSDGWEGGADVATVVGEIGGTLSSDTRSMEDDVISLIFNERGLHAGATLNGIKYSRILR